jgi:hypothetical protein
MDHGPGGNRRTRPVTLATPLIVPYEVVQARHSNLVLRSLLNS